MIVIVDYGAGNLMALAHAFSRIGVPSLISNQTSDIERANALVIPGVANFEYASHSLHQLGLTTAIKHAALSRRVPTLGICLGFQILFDSSEESQAAGLGILEGHISKIKATPHFPVPNIGWRIPTHKKQDAILSNVSNNSSFYFSNSYALKECASNNLISAVDYSDTFVAIYRNKNIVGTQFHPEKSLESGAQLLRNFCSLL